tara:strand:- start:810 stop:1382 length:573 start_codon:yes stop_codon:yes gene_type:complete
MKDINELAREYALDHSSEHDMLFPQDIAEDAFTAGYQKAREDLLSQVSDSFKQWVNQAVESEMGNTVRKDGYDEINLLLCGHAYQEGKLSSLKEIEKLKAERAALIEASAKTLSLEMLAREEIIQELKSEIAELKEDIESMCVSLDWIAANATGEVKEYADNCAKLTRLGPEEFCNQMELKAKLGGGLNE